MERKESCLVAGQGPSPTAPQCSRLAWVPGHVGAGGLGAGSKERLVQVRHLHSCRKSHRVGPWCMATGAGWGPPPSSPPSLASSALFTREHRPSTCCMRRAGVVSAGVSGLRGHRPCAQRPYSSPGKAPRTRPVQRRCWRLPRTEAPRRHLAQVLVLPLVEDV